MGVLQDFERRLEGAVEGVFARIFRSGLQPIEMAKGLQRYARDMQHVSHDGVVVPNAYRFTVSAKDHERFARLGIDLPRELADVVTGTARERDWVLRGPAIVRVVAGDVPVGRYDLVGRIESVDPEPADEELAAEELAAEGAAPDDRDASPAPAQERPAAERAGTATSVLDAAALPPPPARLQRPTLRVVAGGPPMTLELTRRTVAGRADAADITLEDATVSREHAAFVRRSSGWWVVDLGSMNGTKVNGRAAGEHELGDGDTIELGEAVLEFVEG